MGELDTYRNMRDFRATPEPSGGRAATRDDGLSFVVQKHDASRLHYDFRLEWHGVLLSWAVPKGPVPDPSVKRLAIRTEDHPIDYGGFEGVIPREQYGGGTVMLWDRGTWIPEGRVDADLEKGHLDFTLHGEKLSGRWSLIRTGAEGKKERWLLFKRRDDEARPDSGDALLGERELSVASGRSMGEIAADRLRIWRGRGEGGGTDAARPASGGAGRVDASTLPGARAAPLPDAVMPQLATLVNAAPDSQHWLHEIKLDGYRLLCRIGEARPGERDVRLLTRKGNDWTERFPRIARAAGELPVADALLDGEAVVLDRQGKSDFQALQQALGTTGRGDLFFYAFDLLHLDGYDITRSPLSARKAALEWLMERATAVIRYSDHVTGRGPGFLAEACRMGLEGIISKRAGAPYSAGRGKDWLKLKCLERQEFVVVGWTEPSGSRTGLGALVLGVHEDGALVYAGRVGTGFTMRMAERLRARLEPLGRKTAPVKRAPGGARGREIHWVRPELVAEVQFMEWTADGVIRHPSFQGLREDKAPWDIVRERKEEVPMSAPRDGRQERSSSTAGRVGRTTTAGRASGPLRVAGVSVSSPDRVVYPDAGITKGDLARYWEAMAEIALPHLRDRPLTLVRCPEGISKPCFFQKHAKDAIPETVGRVVVPEKSGDDKADPYMLLDSSSALLALVQLGVVEFHVWNARADRLDRPDTLVMDLDPGPDVPWQDVVFAATAVRDLLQEVGLESWPRATGGNGLHVVVPLVRRSGWDEVKAVARALADLMASAAPDRFVATASKDAREGKVYVDYLRNGRNATAIGTFSPRARSGAPVALPLTWPETETLEAPPRMSVMEVAEVDWAARDPWAGFHDARQSITKSVREAFHV